METVVKMKNKAIGQVREFPFAQAEALLRMPENGGWELDDKNYEFTRHKRLVRK